MGRNTFLIQIKGHKDSRKKQTFPGVISISSQNAQVNTPLALDCDQVSALFLLKNALLL